MGGCFYFTTTTVLKDWFTSIKLDEADSFYTSDTEDYLVYHKFGHCHKISKDKKDSTEACIREFKNRLHRDINPHNLAKFIHAYMKRTEILDKIRDNLT